MGSITYESRGGYVRERSVLQKTLSAPIWSRLHAGIDKAEINYSQQLAKLSVCADQRLPIADCLSYHRKSVQ